MTVLSFLLVACLSVLVIVDLSGQSSESSNGATSVRHARKWSLKERTRDGDTTADASERKESDGPQEETNEQTQVRQIVAEEEPLPSTRKRNGQKRGTVVIEGTYSTNLRWCYNRCSSLSNCTSFIYQVPHALCILEWDVDQM